MAKAYSKEALDWFRQQKISCFIVIIENCIEKFCSVLLEKRLLDPIVVELNCSKEFLHDISDFAKCLSEQKDDNCELPLPIPAPPETKLDSDNSQYSWNNLKDLIVRLEEIADDYNDYDRFIFYSKFYDIIFREYNQHLKFGRLDQARVLRKFASDLLLKCSDSCHKVSKNFTFGCQTHQQFLFLSVMLSKFSLFSNQKTRKATINSSMFVKLQLKN